MITFGSLFSGIGGADLAFERCGMICKFQCEIDPKARDVEVRHWPNIERHNDVREIGKRNLATVDVLVGGFPCQDLSVAGKRAGLAGERSGLWFEFARIIDELEPAWVVIENVPGLLSSDRGRDFAIILQWLAKRGYGVAWRVLDSQYFGVAQRRRRVFVVASFGNGRCAEVLFESEGLRGDTPPSREKGERPAPTIAGGFKGSGGGNRYGMNSETAEGLQIARTIASGTNPRRNNPDSETFAISGFNGYSQGIGTLRSNGGDLGGGSEMLTTIAFSAGNSGDSYGIGASEELTPPIRAGESGTNQVPTMANWTGVRRLTPTECARLQGFPDDWNAEMSDSTRYRQLGNAMTVNVLEWIGLRLMEALR